MKVGIVGTRGIPNNYGGFEQFAEFLSVYLIENDVEVFVYNTSDHTYKEKEFKGVKIIHCLNPEKTIGTVGQFIYDLNCILDARKRKFDVLLQLGYTSSSIWSFLFPKKSLIITNMDGLEWKRTKYNKLVRGFLKYAEKLAVNNSDFLIADSIGIQSYLKKKYNVNSTYIPYGAEVFNNPELTILDTYKVKQHQYNLLIARIEPENNIETILDGVVLSKQHTPFLVVGNPNANNFGKRLLKKYEHTNVRFLGSIYSKEILNCLRTNSSLYFHGHSVGGTNPSLLEAMADKALIVANNNIFNRAVLGEDAFYFSDKYEIKTILEEAEKEAHADKIENNIVKIKEIYNLTKINKTYHNFFNECLERKH